MPKKLQPFYFFMLEVQKKNADLGKKYSLREMPEIASPLWEGMTKEEKKPYEEMASREGGQEKSFSTGIKTSHGVDYSEIEKEQKAAAMEEKLMKEDVKQIIKNAILAQNLTKKNFFLLHINYFCESKDASGELRYDAAELAILEFSLQNGIGRGMHTLMCLPELPYGYYFEAKRHSSDTHDLPLPPDTVGKTTIRDAIIEAIKFVNCNDEDVCSPIFTIDNHIPVVRSVINEVLSSRTLGPPIDLRVHSLSELLFHLKNATHDQAISDIAPPFASVFLAETYLNRGTFDYAEGLACEYHEAKDRVSHCSQTKVRGWAYSIIKSCGPDLGIELISGKHEPLAALAFESLKIADDESFFTAADLESTITESHASISNLLSPSTSKSNTSAFPRLSEFKRGKGRGNLL
ncbi:protein maelstrom homolog [Phlebotomus papatasi]|uniref:protein maelstrom homolog n=1 Tax=Phlebotomus papatasi TaxID=29031 RepID=UPI0024834C45|nr:protein maelstrom homolog [Phlebotomus papatasi]